MEDGSVKALLAKWIVECLKGDKYILSPDEKHEIHATWEVPKTAPNGNSYDIKIDYVPNGVWCSTVYATTISMEHAIDFDNENDQVKFDHPKLTHLLHDLENALTTGGNYEIKLVTSHGTSVVRMD